MPKLDPNILPRPKRQGETKTWSLDGEEYPLTLTLRRLSYPEDVAAQEDARQLIETYLTGNEVRGPAPFPDPDIPPSETFFLTVCRLCRMQCPADPADAYDIDALMTFAVRLPRSFTAAAIWANTIGWGDEQSQGESPRPPTATS